MAVMKMRGFGPENYAMLHPGGQLGKRLLITVGDIMRSGDGNPVVKLNATIQDMLFEITSKQTGAVSVVDDEGGLLGLVTDYDIRMSLDHGGDLFSRTIRDIMNSNPTYLCSDEKAITALDTMRNREKPFLVLPVLDRHTMTVVGMLHVNDLIAKGL